MKTLALLVALSVLMLAGCGSNAPHGHSPVVIIGDSITARIPAGALPFAWLNLGKGGDTSSQMLFWWIEVNDHTPDAVIIAIGINDLRQGVDPIIIINDLLTAINNTRAALPTCKIYIQSILPVNNAILGDAIPANTVINDTNALIETLCINSKCIFIGINSAFVDTSGQLRPEYTIDGIHLTNEAEFIRMALIVPEVKL